MAIFEFYIFIFFFSTKQLFNKRFDIFEYLKIKPNSIISIHIGDIALCKSR